MWTTRARCRYAPRTRERRSVEDEPQQIVAPTEAEAHAKGEPYHRLIFTDAVVRYLLSEPSGYDFATADLDGPFPAVDPALPGVNGALLQRWATLARAENLTPRRLAERATPCWALVGSPGQVADHFEQWLEAEACEGFLLTPLQGGRHEPALPCLSGSPARPRPASARL